MNIASLELCRDLFELSGWGKAETHLTYYDGDVGETEPWDRGADNRKSIPAYDLGYLLRQLPKSVTEFWGRAYPASPCLMYSGTQWVIFYQSEMTGEHNTDELFGQFADTPEDAACALAIELFKQGVLKRG